MAKEKSHLAIALDFAELCSHGVASYAPYCVFRPGWIVGYDGITACGVRTELDMHGAALDAERFRTAVSRASEPYSLTVLGAKLAITGHKFRAELPFVPPHDIPNAMPDAPRWAFNQAARAIVGDVAKVTAAKHAKVNASAVAFGAGTVRGMDDNNIIEGYHGLQVEGAHLLPREFVDVLCHTRIKGYAPTAIGVGNRTFTVWFGENAWLRCNTYEPDYPNTDGHFASAAANVGQAMRPVSNEAIKAVETLKPFVEDGYLYINKLGFNVRQDGSGAQYHFQHWFPEQRIGYMSAWLMATHAQHVGFTGELAYWQGQLLRGMFACS